MTHSPRLTLIATGFLLLGAALAGCTDASNANETPTAEQPSGSATPESSSPSPLPATPTTSTVADQDPRDVEYREEIAAWADPLPPGFAWPTSTADLPAGRLHGTGDWTGYTTAAGIYHCMLVQAAWDAYFEDDDPVASKDYAARADATLPEVDYPVRVTRDDGTISDQDLASESGICNGFVGDLRAP